MPPLVIRVTSHDDPASLVAFTAAARSLIAAACQRAGQQVILLAWPAGATYLPADCYTPSEFDVVITHVSGCPVYADTRRLAMFINRRVEFDADTYTPSRPHPPLRARDISSKQLGSSETHTRFDPLQARVGQELMRELVPQYIGVFGEQTIATYVREAVDDLRGSARAEALPELAARLAHQRLDEASRSAADARSTRQ